MAEDKQDIRFSDYFGVNPRKYKALNISLLQDNLFFIDPFRLFSSLKEEYQREHRRIVDYVNFLVNGIRDGSLSTIHGKHRSRLLYLCTFPERPGTWLGYSVVGNMGTGLAEDFAEDLVENLSQIGSAIHHVKQLGVVSLFRKGVGKDHISDFATNLLMDYLAKFTQSVVLDSGLNERYRDGVPLAESRPIKKARINYTALEQRDYDAPLWTEGTYTLPIFKDQHIILIPTDMLVTDNMWLNLYNLESNIDKLIPYITNEELRERVNRALASTNGERSSYTRPDVRKIGQNFVPQNPQIIELYVQWREDQVEVERKTVVAKMNVAEQLMENVRPFIDSADSASFYKQLGDSVDSARQRAFALKDAVENHDWSRMFYLSKKKLNQGQVKLLLRDIWMYKAPQSIKHYELPIEFRLVRGQGLSQYTDRFKNGKEIKPLIIAFCYSAKEFEIARELADEVKKAGSELIIIRLTEPEDVVLYQLRLDTRFCRRGGLVSRLRLNDA